MTDDSLRTRIATASLAGTTAATWTVLPEIIEGRWARLAARGALIAGAGVGLVLIDPDPRPRPRTDEKMAAVARALDDPVQRAGIWLVTLVAGSAVAAAQHQAVEAAVSRLRRGGSVAPRTLLGLGLGALAAGTQLVPESR